MTIDLSVVAPVYNEAGAADELISRILTVLDQIEATSELIVVDDASGDGTSSLLEAHAARDKRVKVVTLLDNVGQFTATQRGLGASAGEWIVVLDGDLQDPPEHIAALWKKRLEEQCEVVFATKSQRDETLWFSVGQRLYHRVQRLMGSGTRPANAGSYSLMSRRVASRVQKITTPHLNLSVAVSLAGPLRWSQAPYAKAARSHGESRVGFLRLCLEALHSLSVTGALHRLALAVFVGAGVCATLACTGRMSALVGVLVCFAVIAASGGLFAWRLHRRVVAEMVRDQSCPRDPNE